MTTPCSSPASSGLALPTGSALTILAAVSTGFVVAALDLTVVNVAGPELRRSLDLSVESLTWAVDAYILTFASLLILAGAAASRFGARRLYVSGLTLFVLASVACALAPTGAVLIGARAVQGCAAALFIPASLVLLTSLFRDPEQRARMVALWSTAGAAASGVGPVVGGLLVSSLGWRSIFFLNVPVGVVGLVATLRVVSHSPTTAAKRIEYLQHVLLLIAVTAAALLLIGGPSHDWAGATVTTSAVAAVVFAVLFVARERSSNAPIWPRELVRRQGFSSMTAVGFGLNFGLYGILYALGLLLQEEYGLSAGRAGLQLLPIMLVFVAANLAFARVVAKVGVRWPVIIGLVVAAAAYVPVLLLGPRIGLLGLTVSLMIANAGLGVAAPAMTVGVMESAGNAYSHVASSTFNATRQFGTLFGVAVAGSVIASTPTLTGALSILLVVACASYLLSAASVRPFTRSAG
ncbi:MFS transporter [Rhodococcus rhodnii]|uniref:Putative MFS transporter n=1 Tax=Rhodococcus rhodnii LMG 5362 TaxID=1273125 RepID=R7WKV0_9NOCA|nr:MFS transporter [Rhodococcus rhodnii]EOM74639.1 putative MFS transporter [Rhodococcus rhodnii LMG 5362]